MIMLLFIIIVSCLCWVVVAVSDNNKHQFSTILWDAVNYKAVSVVMFYANCFLESFSCTWL